MEDTLLIMSLRCCNGRRDLNDETYLRYFSFCECPRAWWATTQTSPSPYCYVTAQDVVILWGWAEPCFTTDDGVPALRWDTQTTNFNGTVQTTRTCGEEEVPRVENKYTGSKVEKYDLDGNRTTLSDSLLHEQRSRQILIVDGECEPQPWSNWVVRPNPLYNATQCPYVSHTPTTFDIANVNGSAAAEIIGTITWSGSVTEQTAEAHQLYTKDCNTYGSRGTRIKSAYQTRTNSQYEYEKQIYAMVFENLVEGGEYEYSFNVYFGGSGPWPSTYFQKLQYTHTVTGTFIATADFQVVGGTGVADDGPYGAGKVKDVVPQTPMPFIRGDHYEYGELAIELKQPT